MYDAVVIGGGVIGCAVTYFLSLLNMRVCLTERSGIAAGTSSASAGHTSVSGRVPGPSLELALASIKLLAELQSAVDVDFEYVQSGGLLLAENELEYGLLRQFYEKQKSHVALEWLEAEDLHRSEPYLNPDLLGATYSPLDGYVNPMQLARAFVRAAKPLGADIRTQTEVTGLLVERGRIAGVRVREEIIKAAVVVNAAGVWSPEIGNLAGIKVHVIPRKGQLIVTESLPVMLGPVISHAGHVPFEGHGIEAPSEVVGEMVKKRYMKQVRSGGFKGRFYVGSTSEFVGFDRSNTYEGIAELAEYAVAMVPALRHARLVRSWAGLRPRAEDGKFIIGQVPSISGFYLATGHDSVGVLYSAMTAKMLAELIVNKKQHHLLAQFDPARFMHRTEAAG